MGSTKIVRAKISKKGVYEKYWIPKERYMELLWFCRQYPEWRNAQREITITHSPGFLMAARNGMDPSDPTFKAAEKFERYAKKVRTIAYALTDTVGDMEDDATLETALIYTVCFCKPFQWIQTHLKLPYSRASYYRIYRKFFWCLDKRKD